MMIINNCTVPEFRFSKVDVFDQILPRHNVVTRLEIGRAQRPFRKFKPLNFELRSIEENDVTPHWDRNKEGDLTVAILSHIYRT